MKRSLALTGALVLLTSSCAHVPDRPEDAGLDLPEQWLARPGLGDPVMNVWWVQLGGSNLLTLVDEALTNNYNLQAAAARVEAATAEARIVGADLYPTLGAGFDASRSQRNFIGLPIPGAGNEPLRSLNNAFGLNLTTSWELDLWGRLRSGRRAAESEVARSQSDFEASRLSLAGQVSKTWMAALEASEQLELAQATLASYQVTAEQIRSRFNRGLRPALDLRLALASVDNAQALVEARRVTLEQVTRQLEILLGRYPSGRAVLPGELPAVPDPVPAGLPSELLARRPDVSAAARRLTAADWRVAESKAALLPRISLTASGGTSSEELADLLDPNFKIWNIAANLTQPIFQGGRLRAGVDLSKARVREALAAYQAAALQAFAEVESALVSESLLARREAELAEAVDQSEGALRLAQLRYRYGLENFVVVLESQRRLFEAQTQHVTIRRQRLENRIDLHLALGGGFTSPVQDQAEAGANAPSDRSPPTSQGS